MPLDTIKEKIRETTGLSNEEIDQRIKKKLDQLAGLISKEGAAHIVANELGVKLQQSNGAVKIKNILSGMKNIETLGKAIRKYDVREFNTEKRSGKLAKFLMADETGSTLIVLWNDKADLLITFKEGDIVKVNGASARENNGRVELHLGDSSTIEVNPSGASVNAQEQTARPESERKKISELSETDQNVEILGTIVQIFDLKFFKVNADTGKKMAEGDAGNFTYGCVLNVFIDDGTDNIRTVLWKNQVINLLGLNEQQLVELKENPELFEQKKTDLLGMIVKINGRVNKNTLFNRLELVANIVIKDVNPEDEIKKLKKTSGETETKLKEEPKPERKPKDNSKENFKLTELEDDLISLENIEDLEDDL
ncbi:MAG: OB-fold nucleic acid binding domain-containing protein [Candidatus Nanoarchaeia archaeon]